MWYTRKMMIDHGSLNKPLDLFRFQSQDQNKSATWRKSCLVWESLTCNQYHKGHAKHHSWCCGMQKIGHAVVPRNQATDVNPSFCSMMGTHEDTAENHIFHVMSQPWLTIFSASHRWLCPLDQFLQLVPLILRESRLNEKRKSGVWFSTWSRWIYIRIIQSQSDIFKKNIDYAWLCCVSSIHIKRKCVFFVCTIFYGGMLRHCISSAWSSWGACGGWGSV